MISTDAEHVAAYLVKDAPQAEWLPTGLLVPILIGGACALLIVVLLGCRLWRWRVRRSASERAFDLMGLRLRLWPRERRLIKKLAAHADAAPVALLISRGAFERAATAAGIGGDGTPQNPIVEALRRKIFEPR